ncbi:MAG TPA: MFS transporter [Marmoricola sp.]|nr:MFS transporter [Marmoricola sp.]
MRPWRDLPRPVLVLVAARAVNQLGAFTLPFLAVVLVRDRHASLATAGLVTALFGVATIPSRLAGGRLADRIGNRGTIVLGLTGCAGAQLAIAVGTSLVQAMVAAAVLGLAFELYEPPSQAMIADLTDAESRPRAFGLFGAALAAGGVGAGVLATALGSVDLRLLFVADAVTCLACAAVVGLALPATPRRTSRERVAASPWRDPRLLVMLAVGTCFATLYLQIRVGLPLTMVERGMPAGQFGLLMTVSSVTVVLAQPLLASRPASRLVPGNPFGAMRVGYLMLGAGLAGTGWASGLAGFLATTVVWSVGDVLLLGLPFAIVSGLAPEGARGRYLAAYGICWGFAAVLAPLLGTRLLDTGGPHLLWLSCAALAVALAAAQPVVRRVVAG